MTDPAPNDWESLLRGSGALRVLYVVGLAESPTDPYGRSTLRLWSDGSARLEHRRLGLLSSWTGLAPIEIVTRVRNGLADADFPDTPTLAMFPGSTRSLNVRTDDDEAETDLPLYDLPRQWEGVFALLDGITAAIGGPTVSPAPPEPGIPEGEPRPLDRELGIRWTQHGAIRAEVLRTLCVGRSWVEVLTRLPRADEVAGGLDLRGFSAASLDLADADLACADLGAADLSAAGLSRARLGGARLVGADLSWAHLREADLSGADLRGALLTDADLRGADLTGADLREADLRQADLSGAKLERARLDGAIRGAP